MSQNEVTMLSLAFQNWKDERAQGLPSRISEFTLFCLESFLKSYDLSDEELLTGITDGGNDGGIDAIYLLADRQMVREDSDLSDRSIRDVKVLLFQIKDSPSGFGLTEARKVVDFLDDFLDLSSSRRSSLQERYNPAVLGTIDLFRNQFMSIASQNPAISIEYNYITRIDEGTPHPNVLEQGQRIRAKVREHFSSATCKVTFSNTQSILHHLSSRNPQSRQLSLIDRLHIDEGFVGLVTLSELHGFLTDDDGELRYSLFESNVRGWLRRTPVNKDITESLQNPGYNFWILNNGITILAQDAQTMGRSIVTLEDPQIVNGLQTSRAIYEHFSSTPNPQPDSRTVLVRIIRATDSELYDKIVKATNNQNRMSPASLRAMESVHGQIDALFLRYGLFYDRRKGHYRDQRKPVAAIVSPNELVQAVVALLLQRPNDARARPGSYWTGDRYEEVFKDSRPLDVYLKSVQMVRKVSGYLDTQDIESAEVRNIKFYVAAFVLCRHLRTTRVDDQAFRAMNLDDLTNSEIALACTAVLEKFRELGADDAVAKGTGLWTALKANLAAEGERRAS